MIFDSPKLLALCTKYVDCPLYDTPSIVHLATDSKYCGERVYLERLIKDVPPPKSAIWLSRLISEHRDQFWGAWFEIMLYGYLKSIGELSIENSDGQPDFVIKKICPILVEAKAVLTSKDEWLTDRFVSKIFISFREIQKPYVIRIADFKNSPSEIVDIEKLVKDIGNWLSTDSKNSFSWIDKYGNSLELVADYTVGLHHVYGVRWSDLKRDITPLVNALKHKSQQHKSLRVNKTPYVIAIFLQDYNFKPRDVVSAWLGNPVARIDRMTGNLILSTDTKGVSYHKDEIVNTSVSGFLVFTPKYSESNLQRELEAFWVENPFAVNDVKIDNQLFPAMEKFVVRESTETDVSMSWIQEI